MKVIIFNWAGNREVRETLDTLGYKHNIEFETIGIINLIMKFHELGLNVMLPQPVDDVQMIALDYKYLFSQR